MGKIGIIANPASGKDIRRLVSHATSIDNNEKVNIVERIILAAQAFGASEFLIMPDTFQIGWTAKDNLATLGELSGEIEILDFAITGSIEDTVRAAAEMEERKAGCLVVMGGDGTCRAAAKGIRDVPVIAVSTGTNNVYPELVEGTVAGMAAAVAACGRFDPGLITRRDKRIEIYRNGEFADIALVDAVVTRSLVVGAKAVWNLDDIAMIIASRAHPASIGFSAIAGCRKIVRPSDDFGICVSLNGKKGRVMAPAAAGVVRPVDLGDERLMGLGENLAFTAEEGGTVALDGEREIAFRAGDRLAFRITRDGPLRVDIIGAIELAHRNGFFDAGKK